MKRLSNPFSLEGMSQTLDRLQEKQDKAYYAIAAATTAAGMILLSLFPLMAIIGIFKILGGISSASTIGAWFGVLIWIAITAAAGLVTMAMLTVKTHMPSGLGLKEDKSPRLHELIADIGQSYKVPRIDRIIVHDYCELEMISVPRFGLPLINTNVLYIGLPVLQSLSPLQFKGALARKLGQFSAEHNKKTHWIYRWRQYCAQYLRTYNRSKTPLTLPLKLFFKTYTPILNAFTTHIARKDELEADMYALQLMDDGELADVILRQAVSSEFLKTKYWPKIYDMQRKSLDKPERLPHINMSNVLRKGLSENEFAQIMKELINNDSRWNDPMPGLLTRLEHVGQTKLDIPPPVMETAAQRYLGEAFSAVVKLLDKQWLAKNGKRSSSTPAPAESSMQMPKAEVPQKAAKQAQVKAPQQSPAKKTQVEKELEQQLVDNSAIETTEIPEDMPADERRFMAMKKKAKTSKLSQNDAFEFANMTEKFEGKAAALSMYQKILKQDPKHGKTLFAVGRILLSQNDPAGVKILEKAMSIDKGVVAQGCWMLAKHFKSIGDEERSKSYLERAANVSAAA